MTHWTAPEQPKDRKPRAGDTIEDAAALATLVFPNDGIVVRDGNDVWLAAENRTFVVYSDGGAAPFKNGMDRDPDYPLTVLWSAWDGERP